MRSRVASASSAGEGLVEQQQLGLADQARARPARWALAARQGERPDVEAVAESYLAQRPPRPWRVGAAAAAGRGPHSASTRFHGQQPRVLEHDGAALPAGGPRPRSTATSQARRGCAVSVVLPGAAAPEQRHELAAARWRGRGRSSTRAAPRHGWKPRRRTTGSGSGAGAPADADTFMLRPRASTRRGRQASGPPFRATRTSRSALRPSSA